MPVRTRHQSGLPAAGTVPAEPTPCRSSSKHSSQVANDRRGTRAILDAGQLAGELDTILNRESCVASRQVTTPRPVLKLQWHQAFRGSQPRVRYTSRVL